MRLRLAHNVVRMPNSVDSKNANRENRVGILMIHNFNHSCHNCALGVFTRHNPCQVEPAETRLGCLPCYILFLNLNYTRKRRNFNVGIAG